MASDMVNVDEGPEGQLVKVGNDQAVSMQLLQDVYNELTGKTEKLTKSFRLHHRATFEDICQLHIKITQLYEQYNIVGQNCTITLFHVNESSERYSSFERFKMYDSSSLSPVENIRLKYSFLIVLPKAERPQSYDIEIDIHSRAAMHQRSETEVGLSKRFIISLASQTGMVEIEYIDYTVARNFQIAIEQWFEALPQAHSYPIVQMLKKFSEDIPFLFRYVSAAVVASYFYVNYLQWVPEDSSTISTLFTAGVLSFSTIFIVAGVSLKLGNIVESAIDRTQPVSYLKLNRGDENAVTKLKASNRWNAVRGVVSFTLAVAASLFATWLGSYLGIDT